MEAPNKNEQDPKTNVSDEQVVDIAPDLVPILPGRDVIGGATPGTLQGASEGIENITRPIQSPNFKYGVSGWRLNSNGIIQAVGVEIAGNITLAADDIVAVSNGGTGVATISGIMKGNGTSVVTGITPLAGTKVYYVADSSGGAVTRKLTFTDGILTSET